MILTEEHLSQRQASTCQ